MSHINTVRIYRNALDSGFTEEQALCQAEQAFSQFELFQGSLNGFVTLNDLRSEVQILEKDLKVFFGYLVGGTIFVAVLIPIAIKFLGIGH